MKVGLVCPYSVEAPGGVQNQVLGLAGHLTRRGDQVAVIAPGRLSEVRLHAHGLQAAQFTSAGAALGLRYNGSIARVNPTPQAAARVRRWLAAHDFDVLHVHEPMTPSIGLPALRHARVPVVATFHTATSRSRALRLAGRTLVGCIDKITVPTAVSDAAAAVAREYYGRNPIIIPNGFRRTDFTGCGARSVDPGPRGRTRPRLVFLGRVNEPRKGLSVLMGALPHLFGAQSGVEVVVAGQGRHRLSGQHRTRDRHLVRDRATGLGLYPVRTASRLESDRVSRAWVRLAGEISDTERAWLLASADLFIAPHTDRESFGIVLLEAMAAGATVVASDLAPFVDLLNGTDGPLGFSFPAGDAPALAAAIDQALNTDRTRMNQAARHATSRFDWTVVGEQVRAAYRAALTGRLVSATAAGDTAPLEPPGNWTARGRAATETAWIDVTDMRHVGG